MTTLVLPYPVSTNRYWRSFVPKGGKRAIVCLSDEAKSYKSQVGWIARAAGCKPVDTHITLHLTLIPKNGVVMDLDNCLKIAMDSLQGIVYHNDKQVRKISLEYGEADGVGALVVEISDFIPAQAKIFSQNVASIAA